MRVSDQTRVTRRTLMRSHHLIGFFFFDLVKYEHEHKKRNILRLHLHLPVRDVSQIKS